MLLVASIESLAEDILGSANSTKGGVAIVRVQWDVQDQKCLLGPLEVYFLRKHSREEPTMTLCVLCVLGVPGLTLVKRRSLLRFLLMG